MFHKKVKKKKQNENFLYKTFQLYEMNFVGKKTKSLKKFTKLSE